MKNKMSFVFFLFVIIFTISGCSKSQNNLKEPYLFEVQYEKWSPEQVIAASTMAFWGTYKEAEEFPEFYLFNFEIDKLLYGNYDEDVINLYSLKTSGVNAELFDPEELYLLIIEEVTSPIIGEPSTYCFTFPERVLPESGPYIIFDEYIDLADGEKIDDYVVRIRESLQEYNTISSTETEYENEIEELFYMSEYIGKISVIKQMVNGSMNTDTFLCSIDELYKGENPAVIENDGNIYLSAVKGAVAPGNTYFIGFNPADENSVVYSQATVNSIYPASDIEFIEQVQEFIEQHEE